MSLLPDGYTHKDPNVAFLDAIRAGRLSEDEKASTFAGNYMYMGTDKAGKDLFKHRDFRTYLP